MNTISLIILIAGTLLLIYLSWIASIREKRYHGIYRFFSFEFIFLLVLLNYPVWFRHVFAVHQIISWILLLGSLIFAIWGFILLARMGKPEGHMERTTRLITTGLYRYIRHPLYLSLILGGFGIMAKDPGWIQTLLAILNFIASFLTAKVEEGEMIKKFGNEYRDYMKRTKMFFPGIL